MKTSTILSLGVYAVSLVFSLTAQAVRYEVYISLEYDTPASGGYRWNVIRQVGDTAPAPNASGHDTSFPVHNSEGFNVYFTEHVHFAVTETEVDPRSNDYADILYTHYDFDEVQVGMMNSNLDQTWANSGCNPIPIRIADASIAYNCFAYALGYTDKVINGIKYFTKTVYFPSGVPDWRPLQSLEKPDRAVHGYKYEEHGSKVTQETRTFTLGGYTFSGEINVYTGKFGEWGVYKSDGAQAPEYFSTADTKNLKRK